MNLPSVASWGEPLRLTVELAQLDAARLVTLNPPHRVHTQSPRR